MSPVCVHGRTGQAGALASKHTAFAPRDRTGMTRRIFKNRYDWHDKHDLALFIDGDAFFPEMLGAIDEARGSIVLCIYQVTPGACADRWCERLAAAAKRGVEVRVMVDAFGGFPARKTLRELREDGVTLCWFNPVQLRHPVRNLFRDHRKLLVVDGCTGFIGGFCLTDGFDPAFTDRPWHDMTMRVRGPCVADMLTEIDRDWRLHAGEALGVTAASPPTDGPYRCRLVRNHPRGIREIRRAGQRRMRAARRRIWLVTPYFAPSRRFRRILRRAARRGVDVRLLLSGPETDHETVRSAGQRHYGRLLRAGARIAEYPDRCLHMKTLIVDDAVSGGSCNFDHWGLRWNRDVNLEIDGGDIVAEFARQFEADFDRSDEVTRQAHQERPLLVRIRQWLAGFVDTQLVRQAYRRQLAIIKRHPGRPGTGG